MASAIRQSRKRRQIVPRKLRRREMAVLAWWAACAGALYGMALPPVLEPLTSSAWQAPVATKVSSYLPKVAPPAASRNDKLLTIVPLAVMQPPPLPPLTQEQMDVAAVEALYRNLGYGIDDPRLSDIRQATSTVPRVFLPSVPLGVTRVADANLRKSLFLRTLLPLILKVNEDIERDRQRLAELARQQDRGEPLSRGDSWWLDNKAREYRTYTTDARRLLASVDIIPPSLALAQAAEETGWGTSRVARLGNALFGQTTWDPAKGVPLASGNAPDPVAGSIRAFPSLLHAARAYARNLNSHRAYRPFREARAAQRAAGQSPDGLRLAATLHLYSERGGGYISNLQELIRSNGLMQFDQARLATEAAEMASIEEQSHRIR